MRLPITCEPLEVEVELTNYCNAACLPCPRHHLSRPLGFMTSYTHDRILSEYAKLRSTLAINSVQSEILYPCITYAGLGEPLLHHDIVNLVSRASTAGFETHLITNGSLLSTQLCEQLIGSRLRKLEVSFWGIEKDEYEASMGLQYEASLANVLAAADLARSSNMALEVLVVDLPTITSTKKAIDSFWNNHGVSVHTCDSEPWNRAGYVDNVPSLDPVFQRQQAVDWSKPIWCGELSFIDTICWDGKFVACSNDYFEGLATEMLGSIWTTDLADIWKRKQKLLDSKEGITRCRLCRMPRAETCKYAWDRFTSACGRERYSYAIK